MKIQTHGMDIQQEVPQSKLAGNGVPSKPGEHVWIVAGAWRVDPIKFRAGEQMILDTENLIEVSAPGCYVCEQEWSFALASKPCPGDPNGGRR